MHPFRRSFTGLMGEAFTHPQHRSTPLTSTLRLIETKTHSTMSRLAENAKHSAIRRSAVEFKKRSDLFEMHPLKLSIGDLDAPTHFKEGIEALAQLKTIPYSPSDGLPEAKIAFMALLKTIGIPNKHIAPQEQVVMTSGGTGAIELALLTTVNREDSHAVGVLTPSYTNTISVARDRLGLSVKALPLEFDRAQVDFRFPSIDQIKIFVQKHKIRTLVVETYSNPTGAIIDLPYLRAITGVMKEVKGWLVTDEAYANMALTSNPSGVSGLNILQEDPDAPVISIMSTSKWGKLCGGRLGALISTPQLADAAGKVASPSLGPNIFAQQALINQAADPKHLAAFKYRVDQQLTEYSEMASQFHTTLSELTQEINSSQPQGAIYIVCDVTNPEFDASEFAYFCAQRGKVPFDAIHHSVDSSTKPFGTVLIAPMSEFYLDEPDREGHHSHSPGNQQFRLSLIPGTDMVLAAKLLNQLYLDYLADK